MKYNSSLYKLVEDFSKLNDVEGITIAGSHTNNTADSESDYDIYVYINNEIPVEKRKNILEKYSSYMEYNNQFWETEDDGVLKDGNKPIELIYRDLKWIDDMIDAKINKYYADTGYTTCFWANIKFSEILYDKMGKLENLKKKYDVDYPDKLVENIVKKNYPLLNEKMPAYFFQIEKALKRKDAVSVNHRIAAFLASYFDIIFAVNKIPHPGEKKIINILTKNAEILPKNMEKNIDELFIMLPEMNTSILMKLEEIILNLKTLLLEMKLIKNV